jgi:apolipoprotein N-acyltransferase
MFKAAIGDFFRENRLPLLSALLLAISFPPLRTGFVAYFALVPLLVSLDGCGVKEGFRKGLVFGLLLNLLSLYWISVVQTEIYFAIAGYISLVIFQSLFPALFGSAYGFISKRWGTGALIVFPFLTLTLEWLRGSGLMGFPWLNLSLTQTYYIPLIQIAAYTGASGISFWVAALNAMIALALLKRRNRPVLFAGCALSVTLWLGIFLWGCFDVSSYRSNTDPLKVALIQANIDPEIKWDERFREPNFNVLIEETEKIADEDLDLVIWPETATPCYLRREYRYKRQVVDLLKKHEFHLLTGTPDYERIADRYVYYNSAFLFSPEGELVQRYAKLHLVPFGEMIPLEDRFDILRKIDFGEGDFTAGVEYVVFDHPVTSFAVVICFESLFSNFVRQFVLRGAKMLVVITNDCWFGRTAAPFHHAMVSVLRAVEHRIPVARCANTGVSMYIDSLGRVVKSTDIFVKTSLVDVLQPGETETFYTRHGEWLTGCSNVITLLFLLVSGILRRGRSDRTDAHAVLPG